jgi:hypothetical protein
MCLLQSMPFQTWNVSPTLMTWWLILHCSCHRRFQWTKMHFCLNFPILWMPYPASSMIHHLSWHTPFPFTKSKLVLHCIFGHNLSTYHLASRTPMTSQTICFAIPKLYLRSVHPNHPVKKTKPACSPWKIISFHLQDSASCFGGSSLTSTLYPIRKEILNRFTKDVPRITL